METAGGWCKICWDHLPVIFREAIQKGDVVPQSKTVGWGEILLMGFPEQQARLERDCPSTLTVAEGKAAGHPRHRKAIPHELRFNTQLIERLLTPHADYGRLLIEIERCQV